MPTRIHGTSGAQQTTTGKVTTYVVYTSAPNAVLNPARTIGVDIRVTGNLKDISQKNFEVLVQCIGLRAQPVYMNEPEDGISMRLLGAKQLNCEGFRWVFSVEREDAFAKTNPDGSEDPVGLLVDELNGIVLPSGVVLDTGPNGNIEFNRRYDDI